MSSLRVFLRQPYYQLTPWMGTERAIKVFPLCPSIFAPLLVSLSPFWLFVPPFGRSPSILAFLLSLLALHPQFSLLVYFSAIRLNCGLFPSILVFPNGRLRFRRARRTWTDLRLQRSRRLEPATARTALTCFRPSSPWRFSLSLLSPLSLSL